MDIKPPTKRLEVRDEAHRLELAIALNAYRRQLTEDEKRRAIVALDPGVTKMSQRAIATMKRRSTASPARTSRTPP